MLDAGKISAITIDLDDTLWPIWPTIERAEKALHDWLTVHAPMTAALFSSPPALREIREEMSLARPDLKHDMSALRRESVRLALHRAGEDPALADPAFEVFFAERQRVILFADALPVLDFLAGRYPLVAVTNGNADLERIGLARYFRACICAREFGVGKPDPRIFHAAAGAVDLWPDRVLHIGDDATLDALGALNAGMQAAWVNRSDSPWPHEPEPHAIVEHLSELVELFA
ncbi:MAG TPA: HAD-IA family hydrolase [Ramlibacter sp.]|uniref:HAD family hydrolase n=1 Tax=Ramlibacter sp. TaxID=1917967 RepID=UPI002D80F9BA|nr:HAD-IA family hydrolase [Ramlibacter sp.]HET8744097.1 HAD-IA family hydrolase [Ramlibacter sp.]